MTQKVWSSGSAALWQLEVFSVGSGCRVSNAFRPQPVRKMSEKAKEKETFGFILLDETRWHFPLRLARRIQATFEPLQPLLLRSLGCSCNGCNIVTRAFENSWIMRRSPIMVSI